MRNGNGANTSACGNKVARLFIQQRDTIPKQIAFGRFDQQRSLSNAEMGLGVDGAKPGLEFVEFVTEAALQLTQCEPLLSTMPDELPLIQANGALCPWIIGMRKLSSACFAEKSLHHFP
jgi:hypothetical protein